MTELVHQLVLQTAQRMPDSEALVCHGQRLTYAALAEQMQAIAGGILRLGIRKGGRVAVYLEKRLESVVGLFAIATAGATFVPINPLLRMQQVTHILCDCNVGILITSADRYQLLLPVLAACADLHTVIIVGGMPSITKMPGIRLIAWDEVGDFGHHEQAHRCIDGDMAAILYTSGSTGKPKGVVLSHRNLVAGAQSVSTYLNNRHDDRILVVLPLSFDYGLSQLTTAFRCGATAVLSNYVFPRDVLRLVEEERITGLAGVPPLWHQLAKLDWPAESTLRYITNSGGAMPKRLLERLCGMLPKTSIYLMYGLTEAFRSTYLPPTELDRRSNSIGRPIPNADIMVVREDGSFCDPHETGELVHRGALVSLGYWNDPQKTAERFRAAPGRPEGLPLCEMAVWSGDMVYMDEEGYLYFVGRRDEMIKVSGYRISPSEIEEVLLSIDAVHEAVAVGVPHPTQGEAIVAFVHTSDETLTPQSLKEACKQVLPGYMVPSHFDVSQMTLPRNANGKMDRALLRQSFSTQFIKESEDE